MKKLAAVLLCFSLGLLVFLRYRTTHMPVTQTAVQQLRVVATFYPLADFAQQVGGDLVRVTNLTPAGAEPHDFEPTPQDIVAIHQADVFIYNGAGLEAWVDKVLPDLQTDHGSKTVVVKATQGMAISQSQFEQAPNPHTWIDPVLAAAEVDTIANAFVTADPVHAIQYQQRAAAYKLELQKLAHEFSTGLQQCARRDVVTSHDAFGYLAQRYHLNVVPIVGLSPDAEPSAKKMSEVISFVRQHQVKTIFFETLVSPKLSETIAAETGAQAVVFNPIEGLKPAELAAGQNYVSIQRENLAHLRSALACQ